MEVSGAPMAEREMKAAADACRSLKAGLMDVELSPWPLWAGIGGDRIRGRSGQSNLEGGFLHLPPAVMPVNLDFNMDR